MRRFVIIMMVLGALIAVGGVGVLYVQGFNVGSFNLWSKAFEGLVTQPSVLMNALNDPSQRTLIGGLMAGIFGAGLMAASLLMGCVLVAITSFIEAILAVKRKVRSKKLAGSTAEKSESRKSTAKARKPKLPKLSLPSFGRSGFKDGTADLEGGGGPGLLEKISGVLGRIKLPKRKAATMPVTIGSGSGAKVIAEISEDKGFYADLKDWHQRVKSTPGTDFSLIEEARELRERMTRAVSEQVLEEDPMGGEFLLRMMQAWAEKGVAPAPKPARLETGAKTDEASLMEAAISDVMTNGVQDEEDDEEDRVDLDEGEGFLPEHLFAGLDEDDDDEDDEAFSGDPLAAADMLGIDPTEDHSVDLDDDDEDTPFANPDLFSGGDDDEDDDSETGATDAPTTAEDVAEADEDNDDEEMSEETFEAHLKEVYELKSLAMEIDQGMAEWPEYLQEPRTRVATLERSMMAINGALEIKSNDAIQTWAEEKGGAPEWDWFDEVQDRLEAERKVILEAIAGDDASNPYDETDEDDSDSDVLDDFSVTTSAFASRVAADEVEEEHSVEPDMAQEEDAGTTLGDVDGPGSETEVEQDATPSEPAIPGVEEEAPDVTLPAEVPSLEDEVEGGRNLTLDQLLEVEMCDDLLTKWGYSARAAGASEAKLVSTIVSKTGVKRRVVGVAHMVAGWKDGSTRESRRMNLLFRYVPEGKWRLDVGAGIRMLDEHDNYIEVSEELLEHADLKSQKTVIHFYGPGVPEGLEGEPLEGVFVVSRVLTSTEVTERMES